MKRKIHNSQFMIHDSKRVFCVSRFTFQASSFKFHEGGFATIVGVIAVLSLSLIFGGGFLYTTLSGTRSLTHEINSEQGYYASEAGIEDAIYRIKNRKNIGAQTVLAVGSAVATTTIATVGQKKTITAEGSLASTMRKVQTELELSATETDFFYGVQVGEGGLSMGNNAKVNGSVYSNGNVVGSNGARITGDAWVAAGAGATLDANWTVQNADFTFGNMGGGAVVTAVDASGDVGTYTSIAVGSDGFARVSYIDTTNLDLKFARCTDANCSSPVRATVDSGGDIDEVTSLALGSDGFGRISYYHDGNDDLKYAQCTNADCTTRNLAIIDSALNMGDFSSIAITSGGLPRFGYWYDSYKDVRYSTCATDSCSGITNTIVETAGDVGEYISMKLGSDNFGRMSHYDASNRNLKFIRCTNDTCSSTVRTTVDSAGDIGMHTSLALGSDGFARISYYDESNRDLKFARCIDADCIAKNITAVDSGGSIGEYTSIALGADGFARISYYDASNSALKFVRCTNADCTAKNISMVDNAASVGKYTSLALGADGFARISYYDNTTGDLKFVRCIDADCTPPQSHADAAQSFQLATTTASSVRRVSLFIKKVGLPSDITVRIMPDEGGRPNDSSGSAIASGTLAASAVTGNYGWVDVSFTTNPMLNPNTPYWIMADGTVDNSNYWIWGLDNTDGYAQGTGKHSADWDAGSWTNAGGDFNFKVWVGGSDTSITGMIVEGHTHAHSIATSNICGDAYYQSIDASSLNFLNAPTTPTCLTPLTNGTAYPGSIDPPAVAMPISQGNIDQWKNDAAAGGTCVQPICDASGNLILTSSATLSIGPKKITGNLSLDNNAILTLTGTLWVQGTVTLSNGCSVRLDPSYGNLSGILLTDGLVAVSNNCTFAGSGDPDSHIMLFTAKNDPSNTVMTIDNGAVGVIYYAANGKIHFSNGAAAKEATGYGITMDNNATITYESGLANAQFSSGPAAGWKISNWKEVQ